MAWWSSWFGGGKPSIEAAIAAPVPGQDLTIRDPSLL